MKDTRSSASIPAQQVRYFLYARKSTDDASRQLRSIGDQLAEAKLLASREGLDIVEVLTEKQTAKVPGRPVFNSMLDRIQRGEASGIIAWHPDRLARNAMDAGRVIHLIDLGLLKDLRFPTFRFEATAQGKFMLNIMLGQSKYYVDNLSENITRGKRQKIMNGIWPQAAPLGYLNDSKTKTIIPDPVHGPLVTKMFELYATGEYTLRELRMHMRDLGLCSPRGKAPSVSKVQHALTNPMYYGVLRYEGEFYEGIHEPLVTQQLFDQCREVLNRKARSKSKGFKHFMYRGRIRCGECGATITMETQKGHVYLRCTKKKGPCTQGYQRQEEINRQVKEALAQAALDRPLADLVLSEVRKEADLGTAQLAAEEQACRSEIADLSTKIDRLMDAYLERSVSLEEYRETKNRLIVRKRAVEERLDAVASASTRWLEPIESLINASQEAFYTVARGDEQEIWNVFKNVGSNLTLRDRRLAWAPRGAWQLLVDEGFGAAEGNGSDGASAEEKPALRAERIKRRLFSTA